MLRGTQALLLCFVYGGFLPADPALAFAQASLVAARSPEPPTAQLHGRATATDQRIPLTGVTLTLRDADGREVARTLSDADGRFRLGHIAPGTYALSARAEGFEPFEQTLELRAGETREVACWLALAPMAERVEVVTGGGADAGFSVTTPMGARTTLGRDTLAASAIIDGDLVEALSFMPGVVPQASAVSIRGGRPNQSRLQVDGTDMSDPASGESWFRLPADAVSFIEVLANPSAVEFGRFTSGLTVFQSRRAGYRWTAAVNNLEPGLVTERGHPLKVIGLESMSPRVTVGGPLVGDRLSVVESAQLRYMSSELQSRPQNERRVNTNVSSFTRFDAAVNERHGLAATIGVFRKRVEALNLDSFTPPDAAADVRYRAALVTVRETAQVSSSWVVESQVQWRLTRTGSDARSDEDCVLTPEERRGGFFNTQDRRTLAWNWSESLAGSRDAAGVHLFKAGFDVLHTDYRGSTTSRSVRILAADESVVSRIAFGPGREQRVVATDAAAFLQDRWQVTSRVQVEAGVRLDRDGVLHTVNLAPRVGAAITLRRGGTTTLRGGIGLFYERTPSMAGAFAAFEPRTEWTRSAEAAAGTLQQITWTPRLDEAASTARSLTWDVGLDHRLARALAFTAQVLSRQGSHELVLEPNGTGPERWLDLTTRGHSRYRDAEVVITYDPRPGFQASVAYTRASSVADLNAFSARYDLVRDPILRPNVYARTPYVTPHRLITRTATALGPSWQVESALTWRGGFPWTALGEDLQYAEKPNQSRRFPPSALLDMAIERRLGIWKLRGWLGLSVYNVLNQFSPSDVQAVQASSRFGWYFNKEPRQIRLGWRMH